MTVAGIKGNLPLDVTPFVGREDLLDRTSRLLGHVRMITLTGPPGVGKTRLALKVLQRVKADAVWMIDIRALADKARGNAETLYAHLALELGIRHNGPADLMIIVTHLQERQVVLALDNCEHLVPEVRAVVRTLLVAAPQVRILATSRQVLAVEGEYTVVVPPLPLPDAVQLFVEHAAAAGADRASLLADPNVNLVCRRLDGLPLAVRLAAGRIPALGAADLAVLLDDRFATLKAIEHVVAWSYQLCEADEQRLWMIASIFADAFYLPAVTAIATSAGIASDRVVDLVTGLVQKSVLTVDSSAGTSRYGMLDTVREYGRDRLLERGDQHEVHGLHRDYVRGLVAEAAAGWLGPDELGVMAGVHRQMSEIIAAVDHCVTSGDLSSARAILRDLVRSRAPFFWGSMGLISQQLQRVIDASYSQVTDRADAADLGATAALAGWVAVTVGRSDDASRLLASSEDLLVRWDLPTIAPVVFADGGRQALGLGMREGIGMLSAARGLFHGSDHAGDRHMATMVRAMAYGFCGEPEAAREASDTYLAEAVKAQAPWAVSWAMWSSALVALRREDWTAANDFIAQCLRLQRGMDDQWGQTWSIELGAWISAAQLAGAANPKDQARRAAWLLGAAQARQDKLGVTLTGLRPFAAGRAEAQARIRNVLDELATAAATADGHRRHTHAISVALGDPVPRGTRAATPDGLSEREREVVELVAQGLTSAEIAQQLHITASTVDTHVKRIMAKLGVRKRAALALHAGINGRRAADGGDREAPYDARPI
ncbi:ATP-binding protein [Paractinoplanes hotanensis]|uniref:LuxR C-terminal-related transcriptional regulator n=1 Tax=Paractinoplanes hotanensis TaxID=2906497 RepID=A0ABT0YCY8_9ACTN|nr:LuxR C-terminal-related transcriptional regulator [Actinoplanes hotanensis]MCM4083918.1 LuxR C-terminal-related transcriptional regulator [Actinoplanes hotanensis]